MDVTIITVCYNAVTHIEDAIKCVLAQTYKNIEYIIIDGKSTDGTMDIINKYRYSISVVISEEDNGIWDAMNKGIRIAKGDVIYFLNSDDKLYDKNVVSDIIEEFKSDPDVGIIYGKVRYVDVPAEMVPYIREQKGITNKTDFLRQGLCHQGIFAKKWVFDRAGCFNRKYFYADFDWLLSAYSSSVKMKFIDRYIAYYYYRGYSYQKSNKIMDRTAVIYRHFSFSVFLFYLLRYVLIRSLNSKRISLFRYIKYFVRDKFSRSFKYFSK